MKQKRSTGFWVLINVAILLNLIMFIGQTGSLFNYEFTVSIGLQESIEEVTGLGVAWSNGFAFGDTITYIPLFIAGIAGLFKRKEWGMFSMFGALAITVYWPIVNLYAIFAAKSIMNMNADKYILFSILLPSITLYGLWGMMFLYKNRTKLLEEGNGKKC